MVGKTNPWGKKTNRKNKKQIAHACKLHDEKQNKSKGGVSQRQCGVVCDAACLGVTLPAMSKIDPMASIRIKFVPPFGSTRCQKTLPDMPKIDPMASIRIEPRIESHRID